MSRFDQTARSEVAKFGVRQSRRESLCGTSCPGAPHVPMQGGMFLFENEPF
jgi:hypothetical protein